MAVNAFSLGRRPVQLITSVGPKLQVLDYSSYNTPGDKTYLGEAERHEGVQPDHQISDVLW